MLDDSSKLEILNKIISSKTFFNSAKHIELLKYLVHCEIDHTLVKEYTIAADIFNKDKNFNPTLDPQIRIFMHRLRTKIEAYYKFEGKNDKIILTIPKGHYGVCFQKNSFAKRKLFNRLLPIHFISIGILIIIIIANFFILQHNKIMNHSRRSIDDPISENDPVWAHFFNNQLPTTIVVGDDFQFWDLDVDLGVSRQIVDYSITTPAAFEQLTKKNPDQKLQKERHGALPLNCAWNIYDLAHVLYSFNKKADIELSSLFMSTQFDLTNLVDRNIIYIGGFRNLRQFDNILATLPIEYNYTDTFKGIVTVREPETDTLITFTSKKLDSQYHRDIGLIAKLSGSNKENYIFLLGFAFPAQIETVRMLSRKEHLEKVYSQIELGDKIFPQHFFLIIEIKASEFSAMETKVKYFHEVP